MTTVNSKRQKNNNNETEAELRNLSQKYRILEGDHKNYSDVSRTTLRKQQSTIDNLKQENDQLKKELSKQQSTINVTRSSLLSSDMTRLQDNLDLLHRKVAVEEKKVKEAEDQIEITKARIMELRRRIGNVDAAKENNNMIEKQIQVLEGRLEKANIKFNDALTHNKELREKIDNLRKEKTTFNDIYKKLENDLENKKEGMAESIDRSNKMYKERENLVAELNTLKSQAEKETSYFHAQFGELENLIEEDRKTQEFIKLKEREQRERQLDTQENASAEASMRKAKEDREMAEALRQQNTAEERRKEYEEAFAKIREATGIDNIDELVENFLSAEDQNFSLFNYVNELNNEVEKTEEQITELRDEATEQRGEDSNTDLERREMLEELEQSHQSTQDMANHYESKYDETMNTLDGLRDAVQSLFNAIGCHPEDVQDLMGDGQVTESNMVQYLAAIEERAHRIVHAYRYKHYPDQVRSRPSSQATSTAANTLSIVPPSTTEESDGDSDLDIRPLTREELQLKVTSDVEVKGGKSKSSKRHTRGQGGGRN
eukprot:gb/GECH01009335.1/.p1 GENE.gb/GECH01009335.1/~~gb/GECH01009335.1/.p1  ORF type:complete len:546 (+),score=123.22 gb/GECH01009335.1/:1-1638(+)